MGFIHDIKYTFSRKSAKKPIPLHPGLGKGLPGGCFSWTLISCRLLPKPGCKEIGFRQICCKIKFYTINEAHKQYSLLDTIFNYIFYSGPPGIGFGLLLQEVCQQGLRLLGDPLPNRVLEAAGFFADDLQQLILSGRQC